MRFQTPEMFAQYFYLGVNLIGAHGDEIVGLSVRNLYIGLYSNGICWGMLNENGALDTWATGTTGRTAPPNLATLHSFLRENPMIIDFNNCLQRNFEVLQDICAHRVEIANYVLNFQREEDYEDRMFYESEIRHYKLYDVWHLTNWHNGAHSAPSPMPNYVCSWDTPMDTYFFEIQDAPGEIYDIEDLQEDDDDEDQSFAQMLNSNVTI